VPRSISTNAGCRNTGSFFFFLCRPSTPLATTPNMPRSRGRDANSSSLKFSRPSFVSSPPLQVVSRVEVTKVLVAGDVTTLDGERRASNPGLGSQCAYRRKSPRRVRKGKRRRKLTCSSQGLAGQVRNHFRPPAFGWGDAVGGLCCTMHGAAIMKKLAHSSPLPVVSDEDFGTSLMLPLPPLLEYMQSLFRQVRIVSRIIGADAPLNHQGAMMHGLVRTRGSEA